MDRVVEWEKEKYAVGYKCVTINDNFFTGHFPDRPIMPGACTTPALCTHTQAPTAACMGMVINRPLQLSMHGS